MTQDDASTGRTASEDTASLCQQCQGSLRGSPSDDFCSDSCQRVWHEARADGRAVAESRLPDPPPPKDIYALPGRLRDDWRHAEERAR